MDADLLAAEICLREAWPARDREELGGWVLRAIGGGYNRANSVWPAIFTGEVAVEEAIDRAEAFYRARYLPPMFQILRGAEPAGLDARLADRGYTRETPCSVLAKPVGPTAMPTNVSADAAPTPEWLSIYAPAQNAERTAEYPHIFARTLPSHSFLLAKSANEPVAIGLVARHGPDVAVDCILTHPDRRRTGGATAVMRAAEAWAAGEGARRLLLCVVDDNVPARALYAGLGYAPLSAYHYRVKA